MSYGSLMHHIDNVARDNQTTAQLRECLQSWFGLGTAQRDTPARLVSITVEADDRLHAEPLPQPYIDDDGGMWLLQPIGASLVARVERHPELCLYAHDLPDGMTVSLSGTSLVITHLPTLERLRPHFAGAMDPRHCVLIHIRIERLECHDRHGECLWTYPQRSMPVDLQPPLHTLEEGGSASAWDASEVPVLGIEQVVNAPSSWRTDTQGMHTYFSSQVVGNSAASLSSGRL